jgi:integrase
MARVATKLTPTCEGGFSARKRIPADVQDTYQKLYKKKHEEWFNSGPMPIGLARAKHREWLNEFEARITNIRAERKGDGRTLSPMQARALSGEWYSWFLARHLATTSPAAHWEQFQELLSEKAFDGARYEGDPDDPRWNAAELWDRSYAAREPARCMAADWAETTQFLHMKHLTLETSARDLFLDYVCRDLFVALDLLIRRGKGDYTEDTHPTEFPKFERTADPSITPWSLFGQWVAEVKPRPATVDRWRSVFLKLTENFPRHSAAMLTPEEAREWLRGLIGPERSARTVRDVWKVAAHTVFAWAVEQKLITRNPFAEVKVTVPRAARNRDGKWFTPDEIKTILHAAIAISNPKTKTQAARRWLPWLCAYTGARSGEIAQLRGQDVDKVGGIHAIRITAAAGTVKNRTPRVVPLHEHLLKQGFIEFVHSSGRGPLFYTESKSAPGSTDATNPPKPPYVQVREDVGEWVRKLGVKDDEIQPNHAWRHTFKLIGSRHGMREHVLDAICGHAPASVGRGYGTPELIDKAKELKKFPRYRIGSKG